jgi:CDP-glucose 4,6-dehydratase
VAVIEVVNRILRLMGSALQPDIRAEAKHEILEQFLDASKAKRMLGWVPMFSLDEGLRRTIAWYRESLAEDVAA